MSIFDAATESLLKKGYTIEEIHKMLEKVLKENPLELARILNGKEE
ncbi:hypothetical protein [Priestia aryabhattai]|nr:hypothetical protein [Priestia aryabhattai]